MTHAWRSTCALSAVLCLLAACPNDTAPGADTEDTGGSGLTLTPTSGASSMSTGGDATTVGTADGSGSGDASGAATMGGSGNDLGGSDATGNDPGNPVDCGGAVYGCGDGIDNDMDGHVDLQDPECTGPCDDDESSFQTGLPGDNMDCKQDCFFDGNSGQGDDGCIWDLRCDPENPGENVGCAYTGGNNCNNLPPNQDPECVMFCEQYVPPGCDCFGCCTVSTPDGDVNIFLNSGPDCSLDNLDACSSCTPSEDCVVPCVPDECQICFGQTEPPEGCGENACAGDLPCQDTSECPTDFFCFLGCCYPPPPG